MAMVIMGANMAGIYGAQIFRSDDKPRYRRAFAIGIGVLAFGTLCAIARKVDEHFRGRQGKVANEIEGEEATDNGRSNSVPPSDVQPAPLIVGDGLKVQNTVATRP
jgi:hypothetical protein